jgi:hypothetical protein
LRSVGDDDFGVVNEPVDHGGGDHVVAEDLAPPNRGWDMFRLGICAAAWPFPAFLGSVIFEV